MFDHLLKKTYTFLLEFATMTLYHKLKLYRILLLQLLRYCGAEVSLDLRQKVNKDFSLGKLFVFSL